MICRFEHGGLCCNSGSRHYEYECKKCECMIPISNAERIRSMTDDELSWSMMQLNFCPPNIDEYKVCGKYANCHQCWLDWLKQPYKEDT